MNDHLTCPECDSTNTQVVNSVVFNNAIERVHICDDCPTQWVVEYVEPEITDVMAET